MSANAVKTLDEFLQQRMYAGNISGTTLVLTFFCDVVTQHGGEIWLGSVIHALTPLGINERLTRTAVFRLVQDGWLESRKKGRQSYYRLTRTGQNYYKRAAMRIYSCKKPDWDGSWDLIFTSLVPEDKRDALKRGLTWLGYGRMAAGVYALPCNNHPPLHELLTDLGLVDDVVQMKAHAGRDESLQKLVLSRWKLNDLRNRYSEYFSRYLRAKKILQNNQPPDGHSLFLLRILLIHEYRRILLSDPELPSNMLPEDWEGYAAQSLTSEIYRGLAGRTTEWINSEMLNAEGSMKGGSGILESRFTNPL